MQNLPFVGDFCTPDTAVRGGLLAGLFLAGVAGSVVHCAPMCGAFVLGQVSERMARLPASQLCEWRRIGGGMLLPYHLGRLMTYAALGTLAAGSAAVVARSAWFTDLSAALLVAAAVLFLALAARRVLPARVRLDHVPRSWGTLLARVTRPIPRGTAVREFLLGIALGFLPCGFLYAALTAAATTGQPMLGAGGMVAFGLGTVPSLMVVGIAGHAAGRRFQRGVAVAGPVLMGINAMLLLALAWQRMA
ncbi:MAG: sulfite exporter TauE/SafE family protein [Rhodopila sp.]